MTSRSITWMVAAVALAAAPASAQQSRKQAPPAPLPSQKVAFPPLRETSLANGMSLLVVERHDLPIATVSLYLPSGTSADPVGRQGLASMTAELLTKGTTHRNAKQIASTIEGAGGSLSADAAPDYTVVSSSILVDRLPLAFELMSDVVRNASFPADELETARTRMLSALQVERSRPEAVADRILRERLYGASSPYGAAETPATLNAIKLHDVSAFRADRYRPRGGLLVVAGDVTPDRAQALAKQWFGDWQGGAPSAITLGKLPPVTGPRILLVHRPGSVQSNILAGTTTMPPGAADYRALEVGTQVLGGGPDSRLFSILREQKSWTYGAYARTSRPRLLGSFVANTEVRTAVTDSAVTEVLKQIRRLSDEPIPAADLDAAKGYMIGSFPLRLQSAGSIASQVARTRLLGLPLSDLTGYREQVDAVTAPAIQASAKKYLDPNRLLVVVVGDAPSVKESLGKIAPVTLLDVEGQPLDATSLAPAQGVKVDGSLLKPQVATYGFSLQGNPMGTVTVSIAREADVWVARQEMTSSMVNQKSEIRMKAIDLAPLSVSQSSTAGPMTLTSELKLEGGKVTGTAALPPQMGGTKAFDAIVPAGTLLPGADEFALMVSTLEAGKTITFPIFSIRSGAVENAAYKVTGLEPVTVPAGTFDAYRIELGGDQPRTEWRRKELPHVMVKQEMSGMPVSLELQSLK